MPHRPLLPRRPASVAGPEFRITLAILIATAGLGALVSYPLAPEVSWELTAEGEEMATWFTEQLEDLIWELFNLAAAAP